MATKHATNQRAKSSSTKAAPAARRPQQHGTSDHTEARRDAIELEAAGKWGEAAIAWNLVADTATNAKHKKEAVGRAAAAKVRAQTEEGAADRHQPEPGDATPLEEALEQSAAGAANAASWGAALPEPGYEPPLGRGEDAAAEDEDSGDAPVEPATGDPAGGPAAGGDYVDPEFAKALAARNARKPTSDPRLPPVGTVIVKSDRHGVERARCTITEGGIEYEGTTYKSISAAAMAAAKALGLASKTQDGYAFWGLKKGEPRAAARKDPVESLQAAWERYRERAEAAAKVEGDAERAQARAAIHEHAAALQALTEANALS